MELPKNLVAKMTNYNVETNDLQGEDSVTNERVLNNSTVRTMLGERWDKARRIASIRRHKENGWRQCPEKEKEP